MIGVNISLGLDILSYTGVKIHILILFCMELGVSNFYSHLLEVNILPTMHCISTPDGRNVYYYTYIHRQWAALSDMCFCLGCFPCHRVTYWAEFDI